MIDSEPAGKNGANRSLAFRMAAMVAGSRAMFDGLLDLVLPSLCAGCCAPGVSWCPRCASGLDASRLLLGLGGVPPTVAVGPYSGALRAGLLAYKERGRHELIVPFAQLLGVALLTAPLLADTRTPGQPWWLVPAPSRASAVRARGRDHMRELTDQVGEWVASAGGTVGVSAAVRMRAGAHDSVGLDARARRANLRGRLLVRSGELPPSGAKVVLVDDVITTGSTLRGCSEALAAAGVVVSGALVLCDATSHSNRSTRMKS